VSIHPPTMSPGQVAEALAQREIVLVDAGEPTEFAAERTEGALLYPLPAFDAGLPPKNGMPPSPLTVTAELASGVARDRR